MSSRFSFISKTLSNLLAGMGLFVAAPGFAMAMSCEGAFTEKAYVPSDPVTFLEIIPRLNSWKSERDNKLKIQPDSDTVTLSGGGTFKMKLSEEFATRYEESNLFQGEAIQDAGRGLAFNVNATKAVNEVEILLRGKTRLVNKPFEVKVNVKLKTGSQKVKIPWDDFKNLIPTQYKIDRIATPKNGTHDLEIGSSFLPAHFLISEIEFSLPRDPASQISLQGPIYRDFDLQWIRDRETEMKFENNLNIPSSGELGRLTSVVADALRDPESLEYAFHIISQGHDAIEAEVNKYGYYLSEINGKLSADEFFILMSTVVTDPKTGKRLRAIPIESGSFALYHGRYTHAAQMLAILYKQDASGERSFSILYNLFNAYGENVWRNLWNILFDAPGSSGQNAPRWWVKEFIRRMILAEPAASVNLAPNS